MSTEPRDAESLPNADEDVARAGRETYLLHLLQAVVSHRDRDLNQRFEPLGLTVEKYRSMLSIARFPGCTMKELAQYTFQDRTTLTRMIDQMVGAGWVTRHHSLQDRRLVQLNLTPAGYELGLQAVGVLTRANREALVGVDPPQIDGAIGVLEAVLSNLIDDETHRERVMTMRRGGDR